MALNFEAKIEVGTSSPQDSGNSYQIPDSILHKTVLSVFIKLQEPLLLALPSEACLVPMIDAPRSLEGSATWFPDAGAKVRLITHDFGLPAGHGEFLESTPEMRHHKTAGSEALVHPLCPEDARSN